MKQVNSDKVRDQCHHCHLTSRNRGPAHNKRVINFTSKQNNFNPFVFHNFSIYDCHLFFKKLVVKKSDKLKFDDIPKTNEDYFSVAYGSIKFIDSFRLL